MGVGVIVVQPFLKRCEEGRIRLVHTATQSIPPKFSGQNDFLVVGERSKLRDCFGNHTKTIAPQISDASFT